MKTLFVFQKDNVSIILQMLYFFYLTFNFFL